MLTIVGFIFSIAFRVAIRISTKGRIYISRNSLFGEYSLWSAIQLDARRWDIVQGCSLSVLQGMTVTSEFTTLGSLFQAQAFMTNHIRHYML
jgi:hypothetical protein